MTWPFELGQSYNRRVDIHGRYDGQRQGGIITPARYPLVIIITGEEGAQHGYADRLREDGLFSYFGEGQVGDMQLTKGNRAIAFHSDDGKDLLLFRKERSGRLTYAGEWVCEGWDREPAPDRNGAMRSAIVFALRRLEAVVHAAENATHTLTEQLEKLRERALIAAKAQPAAGHAVRNVFDRSRDVRAYVLARARGRCEGCGAPAPFLRPDGTPYLEPHHVRRLSDGGPDHPHFVIALCPNCHRRVHAGADGSVFNYQLQAQLKALEPNQPSR